MTIWAAAHRGVSRAVLRRHPVCEGGRDRGPHPLRRGESYDITHFEPYLELNFEQIVTAQIDFLNRHVGGSL